MFGLIVLLAVLGSLADLARRQEHRARAVADGEVGTTAAVAQG